MPFNVTTLQKVKISHQDLQLSSNAQRRELAVKEAILEFKRIDVLVNAAGATRRADLLGSTEEEWDYVMAVNLKSIFSISKFTIPNMIENGGGSIVNISSDWGIVECYFWHQMMLLLLLERRWLWMVVGLLEQPKLNIERKRRNQ